MYHTELEQSFSCHIKGNLSNDHEKENAIQPSIVKVHFFFLMEAMLGPEELVEMRNFKCLKQSNGNYVVRRQE